MTKQHTPGPWHVANGVQIRSARDQIAKVWMMRNGEGNANARLIAAAPELLKALQALTHSLDYADLLHDDQRSAHANASAIIANATGETK